MTDDDFLAAVCTAKKMPVESAKRYGAKVTDVGQFEPWRRATGRVPGLRSVRQRMRPLRYFAIRQG